MLVVKPENIDSFKVRAYLELISAKFKFKRGKKLFIDCGTNLGQGFEFFKNYFPLKDFDAVLIEPNPYCIKSIVEKYGNNSKINLLQKAVWIDNSILKFYGLVEDERGETSTGASVIKSHNGTMYNVDEKKSIEVEGFSFSDFLHLKSKEYDVIIVKLDIESSEYVVLDDIIRRGTINKINHIFVEFHSDYFNSSEKNYYVDLEKSIISKIKEMGVGISLWI